MTNSDQTSATHVSLKLAIAHTPISKSIPTNSATIQKQIREAASEGCQLIQFPEGAISGYCKQQITDWEQFNWHELRAELETIAKLAQELHIWVIIGSAHSLTVPNPPHNSLYVISDEGKIIDRYDKRYISHGEMQGWYTPGKKSVVFEIDGIKIGLALCLEVQFPEIFDEYRRLGVDAVLLSAYAGKPSDFDLLTRAHAELNNLWIGFSTPTNKIDDDEPLESYLFAPDGHIQAKTESGVPGLAIGVISPDDPLWDIRVKKSRPWRELARKGDIYRERYVLDHRSDDVHSF